MSALWALSGPDESRDQRLGIPDGEAGDCPLTEKFG